MTRRHSASMVLLMFFALGISPVVQTQADGPPTGGQATFEKIKALVGEWDAPAREGLMINIFRPIAFGTAILHEEWLNGEQLTATVFYMVGSELRADHFCDFYNQPRYVVRSSDSPSVVSFELRDITNLDTQPRHFHSSTWRLVDAAHVTQEWHIAESGKDPKVVRLEFTRRK